MPIAPPPVVNDENHVVQFHRGHESVEIADEVRQVVGNVRLVALAHAHQVDRDRAMLARDDGYHVAPKIAGRWVAMDEDYRRSGALLHVMHLRAVHGDEFRLEREGGADVGLRLHARHEIGDQMGTRRRDGQGSADKRGAGQGLHRHRRSSARSGHRLTRACTGRWLEAGTSAQAARPGPGPQPVASW